MAILSQYDPTGAQLVSIWPVSARWQSSIPRKNKPIILLSYFSFAINYSQEMYLLIAFLLNNLLMPPKTSLLKRSKLNPRLTLIYRIWPPVTSNIDILNNNDLVQVF